MFSFSDVYVFACGRAAYQVFDIFQNIDSSARRANMQTRMLGRASWVCLAGGRARKDKTSDTTALSHALSLFVYIECITFPANTVTFKGIPKLADRNNLAALAKGSLQAASSALRIFSKSSEVAQLQCFHGIYLRMAGIMSPLDKQLVHATIAPICRGLPNASTPIIQCDTK